MFQNKVQLYCITREQSDFEVQSVSGSGMSIGRPVTQSKTSWKKIQNTKKIKNYKNQIKTTK